MTTHRSTSEVDPGDVARALLNHSFRPGGPTVREILQGHPGHSVRVDAAPAAIEPWHLRNRRHGH